MRSKDILFGLEDITILCQYLYMSEDNYISIDTGMATLELRMNENGDTMAKNLNFPELPDLKNF